MRTNAVGSRASRFVPKPGIGPEKGECYLARPFVNIHDLRGEQVPNWLTESNDAYSKSLFSRRVCTHPVYVSETIDKAPFSKIPQVAFVGFSNVGKSSLINAVLYNAQLPRFAQNIVSNGKMLRNPRFAPISKTPGRTRHLFTFDLGDKISLVDLPGYGCAKVSNEMRNEWSVLVNKYLNRAENLYRVFSLTDCLKPVLKEDIKLWNMLNEMEIPFQIVLTKCDLIKMDQLHLKYEELVQTMMEFQFFDKFIYATSATKLFGVEYLKRSIAHIAQERECSKNINRRNLDSRV